MESEALENAYFQNLSREKCGLRGGNSTEEKKMDV